MAEHRARITVQAPATEVFAFLANPTNLPRWQPSFREAFREEGDRIRAIGGGVGAKGVVAHARFNADIDGRTLSWASASGVGCAGDVRVEEEGGAAAVEMVLRLARSADRPEALAAWTGDPALDADAALRASLAAVKMLCEGGTQAVDLVSGGTGSHPDRAALRDSRAYGTSATQNPETT
ncbi:SRPBCC family protein [Falsiroseomonas sp. CW058]|uniref:SRPBCC family protein n=1 Tax=Falsiroseomonas sp. CW058 TaxID=3388664 RepID=UPI003D31D0F3